LEIAMPDPAHLRRHRLGKFFEHDYSSCFRLVESQRSGRSRRRCEKRTKLPKAEQLPIRSKRINVPGGNAAVIVDNSTGEIKGIGGIGFWWQEEVDRTQFVKLFLDGIKQAAGLSKSGMQVFELVYLQMRAKPGSDEIKLNQYVARDNGMSDRTYQRGIRELLEKEFLYLSPSDGVFFVNIRFMFNGDRLAFVRSYHFKDENRQAELPLNGNGAGIVPIR